MKSKTFFFEIAVFAAVFAAGAADLITAREATNIAESVVAQATNGIRSVDGSARVLPKYLHVLDFCDGYTNDAAWYYDRADGIGRCSARRIGNLLERNYDWFYDESATFVISMGATDGRFASIGVASVGTNLTEQFVASGKWSRFYKCLPGATLDGVNERGIAVEVNVVVTNGSRWETDRDGRDINAIGAVRWALDHSTSARMAASNLADRVYIPQAMKRMGYSAHFAVCDKDETWVVEDGVAELRPSEVPAVLTNFRVLDPAEPYGTGYERYEILTNEANSITSAWFRAAYRRPFARPTEFAAPGVGAWIETDRLLAWADANVPQGAPESLERGGGSWQTVHSSVYDLERKSLRIAVQETDDWYVFAVPSAALDAISAGYISETNAPFAAAVLAVGLNIDTNSVAVMNGILADTNVSNAVLAVGLNIDTNSVAVLNEIAATFGDFPITGTATTVGGLLAALAAAVAWLRKRATHLDKSGFGDEYFATDLLEKQVAKSAITASLADPFVAKTSGSYAEGDPVTYDGKLYKRNSTTGDDTSWVSAHWTETTVATMWNNADTTSYGGQN